MAILRLHRTLGIILSTLAVLLLVAYFTSPATVTFHSSSAIALIKMASGSNPIDKLAVVLSQTSTSPPTVRVTVTNKNSHPVTIVTYSSPLDGIALPLGLLTITPAGASEPLKLQIIKASRIWPPQSDSLVGLEAGASATNDMVLKEPTVPMKELGGKATVFMEGRWMGVLARSKDKVFSEDLEHLGSQPDSFDGDFKSESIEITID